MLEGKYDFSLGNKQKLAAAVGDAGFYSMPQSITPNPIQQTPPPPPAVSSTPVQPDQINFKAALHKVFNSEGGFSDDPHDSGNWTAGKVGVGQLKGTKYGISAAAFSKLDIKNLTRDQADEIYKRRYWTPNLPWMIAYPLFDASVNEGKGTAIKQLQRALGVKADGGMGAATRAALQNSDLNQVLNRFMANQLTYKQGLKDWKRYGKGWSARMNRVAAAALKPPPTGGQTKAPAQPVSPPIVPMDSTLMMKDPTTGKPLFYKRWK